MVTYFARVVGLRCGVLAERRRDGAVGAPVDDEALLVAPLPHILHPLGVLRRDALERHEQIGLLREARHRVLGGEGLHDSDGLRAARPAAEVGRRSHADEQGKTEHPHGGQECLGRKGGGEWLVGIQARRF